MRAFATLLGLTLAACQGGQFSGPQSAVPADTGVGPRAAFAMASPAGLIGLSADGKVVGRIVALPASAVPSSPTLHPDGKRIFFALSQTTPGAGFGSDIYSVNVDGTDLRPVVKRDKADVFYASPSFEASGNLLYVHRRAAKQEASNPGVYLQSEDAIERVDLRTGEVQKVVGDGAEPSVAPSGKTLIYVHIDRGQQDGLWTASTDGARAAPFLKTGDRFSFLQAPRVSPSGQQIVFCSAGRYSTDPRGSAPASSRASGGGKTAHLDLPSELYVAPLDGTSLRLIATTGDDVVPAWSPDGARIAFIARSVLYVISVADGSAITHAQVTGFVYGDLIWL